jgi:hypothetical protein
MESEKIINKNDFEVIKFFNKNMKNSIENN